MVMITLGPFVAFVVAALSVPLRQQLTATVVALILAVIIVLVDEVGAVVPATTTSFTAAISFNFFHTEPYRSLHVRSVSDALTIGLLAGLGLLVGRRARVVAALRRVLSGPSPTCHTPRSVPRG